MGETFTCKRCDIEQDKGREVKTRYPTRICLDCWGHSTSTGKREQKAKREDGSTSVVANEVPCGCCGVNLSQVRIKPDGGFKRDWCKACRAENQRKNRADYKDLDPEERRRSLARSAANVALKRGQLTRAGCEQCGEHAEMHHDDYSKPLDVRWLCMAHHKAFHQGERSLVQGGTSEVEA